MIFWPDHPGLGDYTCTTGELVVSLIDIGNHHDIPIPTSPPTTTKVFIVLRTIYTCATSSEYLNNVLIQSNIRPEGSHWRGEILINDKKIDVKLHSFHLEIYIDKHSNYEISYRNITEGLLNHIAKTRRISISYGPQYCFDSSPHNPVLRVQGTLFRGHNTLSDISVTILGIQSYHKCVIYDDTPILLSNKVNQILQHIYNTHFVGKSSNEIKDNKYVNLVIDALIDKPLKAKSAKFI